MLYTHEQRSTSSLVILLVTLLLLIRICSGGSPPETTVITKGPENGTFLVGDKPTLNCVAVDVHYGWWLVNGQVIDAFEDGCLIETSDWTSCGLELNLTLQTSCMELRGDISITCYFLHQETQDIVTAAGFVQVFATGKVTNVVLTNSALQWDRPEVRSESNSLVLYNATIYNADSVPVVSETTEDTSLSLDTSLFTPCENYSISILPYQKANSGIEEGIPIQVVQEYPELPVASSIKVTVTRATPSVNINIEFFVHFPAIDCEASTPKTVRVVSSEGIPYHNQTVDNGSNMYMLENLDIRKKFEFTIELIKEAERSLPAPFTVSTFQVQKVEFNFTDRTFKLKVMCVTAPGGSSSCDIRVMDAATERMICQLHAESGEAPCQLPESPETEFLVLAYDDGYDKEPAVTRKFVTPKVDYTPTDRTYTGDSEQQQQSTESSSNSSVSAATVVAIVTAVFFVVVVLTVFAILLFAVRYSRKVRSKVHSEVATEGSGSSGTVVTTYPLAPDNEYEERPSLSAPVLVSPEADVSTVPPEPTYQLVQRHNDVPAPNPASSQYRELVKEWIPP